MSALLSGGMGQLLEHVFFIFRPFALLKNLREGARGGICIARMNDGLEPAIGEFVSVGIGRGSFRKHR